MKITLLTTDYKPNIGGVAQHVYELGRVLGEESHQVEIIAPTYSSRWGNFLLKPYIEREKAFDVFRIPRVLNKTIKFFSGTISGHLSAIKFTRFTTKRLKENPPDVLHWHAIDSFGYPELGFSGPRIWTNHTSNFIDGIQNPRGLAHYQKEASHADQIICPSQELADLTVGIGVPAERVHFITNGVDAARFHPRNDGSQWRNRMGCDSLSILVLCPRRLEKKNGVRYFIQAAIRLLDAQSSAERANLIFAVAGNYTGPKSDSDEEDVREMIANSGASDQIKLLGRVDNDQMPGLYAAADIVVMPSLIEATSLSAMEAMATGKPIVSTDVGGLPFLVRDGENGILVPARDPRKLANGLDVMITNERRRVEFGIAGRKRVESELDWFSVGKQTKEIYDLAMKARLK